MDTDYVEMRGFTRSKYDRDRACYESQFREYNSKINFLAKAVAMEKKAIEEAKTKEEKIALESSAKELEDMLDSDKYKFNKINAEELNRINNYESLVRRRLNEYGGDSSLSNADAEKYEDNGLSSSDKADLNSVIRDVSGNYDERYERLEKAYKKYCDKDIMKEFLPTAIALGVNNDIKGNSNNKDSFYNRLLATGFEYEDKTIDEHLDNINREIEDLTDATANGVSAEGIIASIGLGTYDILDVISSWNSKYKENGEDRPNNIIDKITESYNDMDDSDMKEDVKTGLIKPLIDELINVTLLVTYSPFIHT